jgi:hypothetical protein
MVASERERQNESYEREAAKRKQREEKSVSTSSAPPAQLTTPLQVQSHCYRQRVVTARVSIIAPMISCCSPIRCFGRIDYAPYDFRHRGDLESKKEKRTSEAPTIIKAWIELSLGQGGTRACRRSRRGLSKTKSATVDMPNHRPNGMLASCAETLSGRVSPR